MAPVLGLAAVGAACTVMSSWLCHVFCKMDVTEWPDPSRRFGIRWGPVSQYFEACDLGEVSKIKVYGFPFACHGHSTEVLATDFFNFVCPLSTPIERRGKTKSNSIEELYGNAYLYADLSEGKEQSVDRGASFLLRTNPIVDPSTIVFGNQWIQVQPVSQGRRQKIGILYGGMSANILVYAALGYATIYIVKPIILVAMFRHAHCKACGYSMMGIPGIICPECGSRDAAGCTAEQVREAQ